MKTISRHHNYENGLTCVKMGKKEALYFGGEK